MIQLAPAGIYRPELRGAVDEYNKQFAIEQQFIGLQVMPEFVTTDAQGEYPVLDKENFRRLPITRRAPGAGYSRSDWGWDKAVFSVDEDGHEIPVDNLQARRFGNAVDYQVTSARGADFIIRLGAEKRIADTVMDTGTFTPTNVAVAWATTATSTPLADIDIAVNKLEDALGVDRSMLSLIIPRIRWQNLRDSASVLDVMKSWDSGIQNRESIRKENVTNYLDIKEIIIGRSTYDASDKGQSQSLTQIWPTRYGMVALLTPGAAAPLQTVGLGRQIRWDGGGILPDYITLESYDEKSIDGIVIRARQATDEVIIVANAGQMLDLTAST